MTEWMNGTTARTGASGFTDEVSANEEHVASPPIKQPETSGSVAGESLVRNRVREILTTKHLTHAL
jgi:hypothetical protein